MDTAIKTMSSSRHTKQTDTPAEMNFRSILESVVTNPVEKFAMFVLVTPMEGFVTLIVEAGITVIMGARFSELSMTVELNFNER